MFSNREIVVEYETCVERPWSNNEYYSESLNAARKKRLDWWQPENRLKLGAIKDVRTSKKKNEFKERFRQRTVPFNSDTFRTTRLVVFRTLVRCAAKVRQSHGGTIAR